MTDLEERVARLEERLGDLEARAERRRKMTALRDELIPADVRAHLRSAGKEQLLAIRALVDHWTERLDRASSDEGLPRHESISLD